MHVLRRCAGKGKGQIKKRSLRVGEDEALSFGTGEARRPPEKKKPASRHLLGPAVEGHLAFARSRKRNLALAAAVVATSRI